MTAAGVKHVASWLAGNPPLQQLWIGCKRHLRCCRLRAWLTVLNRAAVNPDIGDDGLTALAEGLQSNSNLTHVQVTGAYVPVWLSVWSVDGGVLTGVCAWVRVCSMRHGDQQRYSVGGLAAGVTRTAGRAIWRCGGGEVSQLRVQ